MFLENIPLSQQDRVIEDLAFAYPTWFFEVLCELEEGKPFVLEDFQINILLDFESRLSITNKCRQAGGSLIFAAEEFYKAYTQKNYRCDIVSKTQGGSADNVAYIKRLWDSLPAKYRTPLSTDNVLSIGFHARNPSVIKSFAPTAAVRGGRKSILFDEYAHWPTNKQEEIFTAALPAILNGQLSLRIISTPLGEFNKFADIYMNRKNDKGKFPFQNFHRHKFIWLDVRRFVRGYDPDPDKHDPRPFQEVQHLWYNVHKEDMKYMEEMVEGYGSEAVDLMLQNLSWEDFLTEMCGSFVNYENQYFHWDVINNAAKGRVVTGAEDDGTDKFDPWGARPKFNENEVIIGIDFGESTPKTDKTVLQVVEKIKGTNGRGEYVHRHSLVLNDDIYGTGGYTEQVRVLATAIRKFRPNRIVVDATSIGGPIVEMLSKHVRDIPIERVVFQNANKEEMIVNLRQLLETNRLWIQDEDKQLHRELAGMKRYPTVTGLVRYSGEPHDDRVWSLALAVKQPSYGHSEFYLLG